MTLALAPALVLDDNPDIREGIRTRLTYQGVAVRDSETGEAAVEQAKRMPLSIAILDIQMPSGMDGISVAEQLRQIQPKLPIIFLTAFATEPEYQSRAQAINDVAWIDKTPDYLEKLDTAVRARFGSAALADRRNASLQPLVDSLLALDEHRWLIVEKHEGVIEHVHADYVTVRYAIGDDLIEQTYTRDQFINHTIPPIGSHVQAFVQIALAPSIVPNPVAAEEATDGIVEYRRSRIEGDIDIDVP
jgi:CheY-like chemotaxis protein